LSELLRLINPSRGEQEQEIVERISNSARQLAKLVTNTLTLMRSDDFRQTLQRAPVDLATLLRSVAEQVTPFVQVRHLALIVELDDDLGICDLDADKIAASVINLLTNAIKFTPDGGRITLSARTIVPETVEIAIEDSGIGLEPRAVGRLFQPFFTQFDSSLHSSGDFGFNKRGLGLGLSIVKQFVELHGGRVHAESALGEGTKIIISLPRHAPLASGVESVPEADIALTVPEPGGRD
jgi:signal transduction histidine kinase